MGNTNEAWPPLPLAEWQDTHDTLHMWMQIVGKIRLAQTPLVNHWWNVPFTVDARGLTTSLMPAGPRGFEMRFDFVSHELVIEVTDGQRRTIPLAPRTVADFYAEVMRSLRTVGIEVPIRTLPAEVENPIPFEEDTLHRSYDPLHVRRFFQVLVTSQGVLERFRSRFVGKSSPVQFFWGSFDLVVTRFSGRAAPPHPSLPGVADSILREAYSHEVCSAGFWPGGTALAEPIYFSYAYPEPEGYASARVEPSQARYDETLHELVIPYEAIRAADAPDEALLAFLQSTYAAAADHAHWDREALEREREGRVSTARSRVSRVQPRSGAH